MDSYIDFASDDCELSDVGDLPMTLNFDSVDLLDDVIAQTLHDEVPRCTTSQTYSIECTATVEDDVPQYMYTTQSAYTDQDSKPTVHQSNSYTDQDIKTVVHQSTDDTSEFIYSTACDNVPSTPYKSKPSLSLSTTTPLSSFSSPGVDSRFNDSLSGLLGSPPPDSPLAKNPFFGDLQAILMNDCREDMLPQSLLLTMTTQPHSDVFTREKELHQRFTCLEHRFPLDVKQLSGFYRYQAALVETERFRSLHLQIYGADYQRSLNVHYDSQLHQIMDRVEKSLNLLEESAKENFTSRVIKPRPLLSKNSVRLMEEWYEQHLEHPYPTTVDIDSLATAGNINAEQVKKWFANKRNRSNNTRTLTEIAKKKRQISLKRPVPQC